MEYLGLFLCAVIIEVAWVAAVRSVERNDVLQLALISMGMQAISYGSTLILVSNNLTMAAGIMGAGVGAVLGLRVPATWFRRADPSS